MKPHSILYTVIFCAACASALLYFTTPGGMPSSKIQARADPMVTAMAQAPDPSGKPNTTTIYKTSYTMPEEIRQALATLWIEKARKARHDPEIADIVENQAVVPCDLPGRVRMEDGNCWLPELWRKLHP